MKTAWSTRQPVPPLHLPGGALTMRVPQPADMAALHRMHETCTERSRRHRWLAPLRTIPAAYLDAALAGSPLHRALVVEENDRPGNLLALASAVSLEAPSWELGVLVHDSIQGQGIGRQLTGALVAALPHEDWLTASAFIANRPLLTRLSRFGAVSITCRSGLAEAVVQRGRSARRP